jgi:hypothetical protein
MTGAEPRAEDVYMMCSSCHTPCLVSEGHVIPGWNKSVQRILTSYRCSNCWLPGIENTREVVSSGNADVYSSFADFLDVQGYDEIASKIRALSAEDQRDVILGILNLLEKGHEPFHP